MPGLGIFYSLRNAAVGNPRGTRGESESLACCRVEFAGNRGLLPIANVPTRDSPLQTIAILARTAISGYLPRPDWFSERLSQISPIHPHSELS